MSPSQVAQVESSWRARQIMKAASVAQDVFSRISSNYYSATIPTTPKEIEETLNKSLKKPKRDLECAKSDFIKIVNGLQVNLRDKIVSYQGKQMEFKGIINWNVIQQCASSEPDPIGLAKTLSVRKTYHEAKSTIGKINSQWKKSTGLDIRILRITRDYVYLEPIGNQEATK